MKINAFPNHPTQTIISGRKLKAVTDHIESIRVKARQNTEIATTKIQALASTTRPPWLQRPPVVNTTLKEKIQESDDLLKRKVLVEGYSHAYDGQLTVYTDGLKNTAGNVSFSF